MAKRTRGTVADAVVIAWLRTQDGPRTVRQIARATAVTAQTVRRVLADLAAAGQVHQPGPPGRRRRGVPEFALPGRRRVVSVAFTDPTEAARFAAAMAARDTGIDAITIGGELVTRPVTAEPLQGAR